MCFKLNTSQIFRLFNKMLNNNQTMIIRGFQFDFGGGGFPGGGGGGGSFANSFLNFNYLSS